MCILKNKNIFIAALDWGLGHATRCVPLIQKLATHNNIIIGVTPTTLPIFEEHFPQLKKVTIEAYHIRYSTIIPLTLKLALDSARILRVIKREHQQLAAYVKQYKIDVVISDNRFGLWNKHTHNIYITHQLQIKAGIFSKIATKIHHRYMKQFHEIWVPDYEDDAQSLAGDLSRHKNKLHVKYIGPLSRLVLLNETIEKPIDYLYLLSGPEPLRTQLEEQIIQLANHSTKSIVIARGTKKPLPTSMKPHIKCYDMPDAATLSTLICAAQHIICRSGYSTLMDLHLLHKKQITLIPTPHQSEQIYLAKYWATKFGIKPKLCISNFITS